MTLPVNSKGWALATKGPNEGLDYVFDFAPLTNGREGAESDWLASGETISTRTITAETGITVDSSSITDTNTSVTVWLSGGTVGQEYAVDCRITTSASRTAERRMVVTVAYR